MYDKNTCAANLAQVFYNVTMNKQQKLDNLAAEITAQKICPELAAQATQLVFGDGNVDAKIVFIGEAPGKNEDLQGKPFVGAAGKFFRENSRAESVSLPPPRRRHRGRSVAGAAANAETAARSPPRPRPRA